MKKAHLLIVTAIVCVQISAKAIDIRDTSYLVTLKNTPTYNRTEHQTYPAFTYQNKNAPELINLRKEFKLDSIAGRGSEVDKAIRLLGWFHRQVPHEDVRSVAVLTTENIINSYRTKKTGQGCYPLSIAMNEIFLAMGFKSRTVICFSNNYIPNGGHVINSLYIDSLKKWIYMDPQENAYIKDEKGNFLSVAEVRERLVNGQPLVLNASADYHGVPATKADYLYNFIAQHLYRIICPVNSAYNSQTRLSGNVLRYVELLPAGSTDPLTDNFETSTHQDFQVINYHTNNDLLFWQNP